MENVLAKTDAKICFCRGLCEALVKRAFLQHVVSMPWGHVVSKRGPSRQKRKIDYTFTLLVNLMSSAKPCLIHKGCCQTVASLQYIF